MKIKDMKYNVRICFDYSKKLLGFGMITKKDLEQVYLKIFLDDGTEIYSNQIKQITFKLNG